MSDDDEIPSAPQQLASDDDAPSVLQQLAIWAALFTYSLFVYAYVLSKLWAWYAVPLFGMKPIHWHVFAVGAGAWYMMRYSTHKQRDNRSDEDQAASVFVWIALPWALLLLGWWWSP